MTRRGIQRKTSLAESVLAGRAMVVAWAIIIALPAEDHSLSPWEVCYPHCCVPFIDTNVLEHLSSSSSWGVIRHGLRPCTFLLSFGSASRRASHLCRLYSRYSEPQELFQDCEHIIVTPRVHTRGQLQPAKMGSRVAGPLSHIVHVSESPTRHAWS